MGKGLSKEQIAEGLKVDDSVSEEQIAELNEIWKKYDKDGSGHLEKKEFYKFLDDSVANPLMKIDLPKEMKEEAFKKFDANSDGHISKMEFVDQLNSGWSIQMPMSGGDCPQQ